MRSGYVDRVDIKVEEAEGRKVKRNQIKLFFPMMKRQLLQQHVEEENEVVARSVCVCVMGMMI